MKRYGAFFFCILILTSCGMLAKRADRQEQTANKEIVDTKEALNVSSADNAVSQGFEPFAVDRVDGFYGVKSYSASYPYTDVILEDEPTVSKREIKKVKAEMEHYVQYPVVAIEFSPEGASLFESFTERNIGRPIAMVVGGKVISMPIPNEKISGGRIQISGKFSLAEAKELAEILKK